MRCIAPCWFTLVVFLPFASAPAQDAKDLQSVIEKSVQAAGGLENLEKAQRHRGREEGQEERRRNSHDSSFSWFGESVRRFMSQTDRTSNRSRDPTDARSSRAAATPVLRAALNPPLGRRTSRIRGSRRR